MVLQVWSRQEDMLDRGLGPRLRQRAHLLVIKLFAGKDTAGIRHASSATKSFWIPHFSFLHVPFFCKLAVIRWAMMFPRWGRVALSL